MKLLLGAWIKQQQKWAKNPNPPQKTSAMSQTNYFVGLLMKDKATTFHVAKSSHTGFKVYITLKIWLQVNGLKIPPKRKINFFCPSTLDRYVFQMSHCWIKLASHHFFGDYSWWTCLTHFVLPHENGFWGCNFKQNCQKCYQAKMLASYQYGTLAVIF